MKPDTIPCPPPSQTLREQVIEFHEAIGAPVLDSPSLPTRDRLQLRLRLIGEEFAELLEAAGCPSDIVEKVCVWTERSIELVDPQSFDMVETVDAFADIDYVVEGSRLELGVKGGPIAAEVHRANMTKRGGPVVDGKQLKPAGWTPPDIAGELMKQGWRGESGDV